MHAPLLELEGTWEQIATRVPDYKQTPLQVTIQVKETPDTLSLPDLVQQIAARTVALNLPPDTRDYLREGRSGEMYGEEEQ